MSVLMHVIKVRYMGIGLFKMFSRWILGFFRAQMHS